MLPDPHERGLMQLGPPGGPLSPRARNEPLDVVFPVLHGTYGEDGTIQGLFELAGMAYVGAPVLGSAAGMDKDVMKTLFRARGLATVDWVTVLRRDVERDSHA